jgi:cytoskeletal protein RodZ
VYAKGSLRTYADYVGLDAEALIRELEDQRAFHPAQDPADGEPPKGSSGITPILPGIPAGDGGRRKVEDEEEAGQTPIRAGGGDRRSYLPGAAALLLVIALAGVALALTRVEDDPPVISQVREPAAHPVAPIGEVGGERARQRGPQREDAQRSADGESNGPKPGEYAAPDGAGDEDLGAGRTGHAGRAQHGPPRAQNAHASTTAPPSSVPTTAAEAAPAATETVASQTPPLATEATPTIAVQSAPATGPEAVPTTPPPPNATPTPPPAPIAAQSVPAPARVPVHGDQDEEVVAMKREEVIAPTWSGSPTRPTVRSAAATARLADGAAEWRSHPPLEGPHR